MWQNQLLKRSVLAWFTSQHLDIGPVTAYQISRNLQDAENIGFLGLHQWYFQSSLHWNYFMRVGKYNLEEEEWKKIWDNVCPHKFMY